MVFQMRRAHMDKFYILDIIPLLIKFIAFILHFIL